MEIMFVFENTDVVKLDERAIVGISLVGDVVLVEIPKKKNESFFEFGFRDRKTRLFDRLRRGDITDICLLQHGREITTRTTYDPLEVPAGGNNRSQVTRILKNGNLEIMLRRG